MGNKVFDRLVEQAVTKAFDKIFEVKWATAYINDLPDDAFAYIAPGGKKDEDGKMVPRSLRYLPYKDADGKIDLPHLRNALARLPQSDLSDEAKKKAEAVLKKAARKPRWVNPGKKVLENRKLSLSLPVTVTM